jgi:predicted NUDIX family NTP pyrophosphohydrolase
MAEGEDLIDRARLEFEEELGIKPAGELLELGWVKQKGGKIVHAWAIQGELPRDFELRCNTFQLEWPPRSGRMQEFPEVDRAEWFSLDAARERINPAQAELLDRLTG